MLVDIFAVISKPTKPTEFNLPSVIDIVMSPISAKETIVLSSTFTMPSTTERSIEERSTLEVSMLSKSCDKSPLSITETSFAISSSGISTPKYFSISKVTLPISLSPNFA